MFEFPLILCYLLIIVTQLGDYFSTVYAMRSRHIVEANPIVRAVGLFPMKVITILMGCAVVGISSYYSFLLPRIYAIVVTFSAVYGWIIWHNLRLAAKYNRGNNATSSESEFSSHEG